MRRAIVLIILGVAILIATGWWLVNLTDVGRYTADNFARDLPKYTEAVIFSLLFTAGSLCVIAGGVWLLERISSRNKPEWPKKIIEPDLGVYVYIHENGNIIIDLAGGVAYRYRRDLRNGSTRFVEEIYPDPNHRDIFVSSID